jgi:hypothetical protein
VVSSINLSRDCLKGGVPSCWLVFTAAAAAARSTVELVVLIDEEVARIDAV